jgi:low affinity Fe/Cu permease
MERRGDTWALVIALACAAAVALIVYGGLF